MHTSISFGLVPNPVFSHLPNWNISQLLFETFFWILHISWDKPKKPWILWFFDDFTMKIKFAPIFTIIFVISASRYINIRSPKKIGHTIGSSPKYSFFHMCTNFSFPNINIFLAAYILVDKGYDVWLGNVRGNTYSQLHKKWTIKDREFWDFR